MSERKRRIERTVFDQAQKVEDVERISNILNRRIKKNKRNPYLNFNGGIDLIETWPSYENKKKRKKKK